MTIYVLAELDQQGRPIYFVMDFQDRAFGPLASRTTKDRRLAKQYVDDRSAAELDAAEFNAIDGNPVISVYELPALNSFRCLAEDLMHPNLERKPIYLRLDGDSDDVATWHHIKVIQEQFFRSEPGQPFVRAVTVEFYDETPEAVFNPTDQVEFAIPAPPAA
ncbi:MAG: hypothetical protein CK431_10020 [Mycobacterium sp.]|nr:MAG: hypothetical protein CK431_10020 [Mycobacterium sp.]